MAMSATNAEVVMHAASWGSEIRFEITDKAGDKVCEGGPYKSRSQNVVTDCNVSGSGLTLRCIDTYGDGWHGGFLTISGEKYCEDFRRGHLKVVEIPEKLSFDYSSTGGFAAVDRTPNGGVNTADLIRGGGDHGEHTNTLSDKTKYAPK